MFQPPKYLVFVAQLQDLIHTRLFFRKHLQGNQFPPGVIPSFIGYEMTGPVYFLNLRIPCQLHRYPALTALIR